MDIIMIIGIVVFVLLFTEVGFPLAILIGLFQTRNLPDPPKIKDVRPVNYNDKMKIEDEMDCMLAADKRRREQQKQQQMQQQMYQQQMYQQEVDQQMQQQMEQAASMSFWM